MNLDITEEDRELQRREIQGFLSLNLYNEDIEKRVKKCNEIYSNSKEYKKILRKLEKLYKKLSNKLKDKDKINLDEIKSLIYQICKFDVHLAYKIGLIDGMKIKNKCT